eukprot:CAMPEP_0177519226 /NCGR_PEP_ID=MMETSP0369-20130122/46974_1 /TAXON_ID=447022 ORGANISM="Scrippsiella hangoei-like, Strain SHHI-4" /NCGR_SAMPLE_ID=MMETSP0369 /ASSEMBLY_ACC=CAM_ASM_000364 /LENGTH=92 /DNA_ID=CAMNT_0018998443 /DNA_START=113 /DNA_END=391 /DNA_ORIENTATION=-
MTQLDVIRDLCTAQMLPRSTQRRLDPQNSTKQLDATSAAFWRGTSLVRFSFDASAAGSARMYSSAEYVWSYPTRRSKTSVKTTARRARRTVR